MNSDEALAFLASNCPLPDDEILTEEVIDKYDEVRRFFLDHPDPRCIIPLLNSFGDGSGFGVFQLVEDVIKQFPVVKVAPHLLRALGSDHRGVRFWCTQMVPSFPSRIYVPRLLVNLNDPDSDIRSATAEALAVVGDRSIVSELEEAIKREKEEYVRDDIRDAIEELSQE